VNHFTIMKVERKKEMIPFKASLKLIFCGLSYHSLSFITLRKVAMLKGNERRNGIEGNLFAYICFNEGYIEVFPSENVYRGTGSGSCKIYD